MTEYEFQVFQRLDSNLLMGQCRQEPGFIIHAYSVDEMERKLAEEFRVFMAAINKPLQSVEIIRDEPPVGFQGIPQFTAKAQAAA